MRIEFSDRTIIEAYGNYNSTCLLMKEDSAGTYWMLESIAVIQTDLIVSGYKLHFFSDGTVRIMGTDRPLDIESPDSDIRALSTWCKKNGWKRLEVAPHFLEDPRGFQFWLRQYIAGNVVGDIFKKYEADTHQKVIKELDADRATENENAYDAATQENSV